jgi:elongator complex protein 4
MAAAAGVGGQALGRSSFSRAASSKTASSSSSPTASGVKLGPNGAAFVSSGIPDLDSKPDLAHKHSPSARLQFFVE